MLDSSPAIEAKTPGHANLRPVYRYAVGSAIIMLVAMSADYTLSYLTPVLVLNFLAPGVERPSLRGSAVFLFAVAAASFAGLLFTRMFLAFPMVFLPLLCLLVFHIYYTSRLQKMKVWLIISFLLIPMVSLESPNLGSMVAVNLFLNAFLAIILVWIVYFIFPEKKTDGIVSAASAPHPVSDRERYIAARNKALVVIPVLVLFFVFNWSGAILVLIFIAILSMNPATSNKKAGIGIILANVGGGLAAIVAFNLLTVVPDLVFLGMLTLLAGMVFGPVAFSKKPIAPLAGMAFSTFLLILGNVTAFRGEAGEAVWSRVFQLGIVVIYIVIAFAMVNYFSSIKNVNKDSIE